MLRTGTSIAAALAAALVCLIGQNCLACTTPVYRVAMYDWPAAPYRVFYFHSGEIPEADVKLHEAIGAAAEEEKASNIAVHTVDVTDEETLKKWPPEVRAAWDDLPEERKTGPTYALFTPWPWAEQLYSGPLDAEAIAALVDSPVRKSLCELLDEGNVTVFLLVAGKDAEANKKAEEALAAAIAEGKAGRIPVALDPFAGPMMPPPEQDAEVQESETAAEGDPQPAPPEVKVASLTLQPDDAKEKWLMTMLFGAEGKTGEQADVPMVFLVYGRGRALPPMAGEQITVENLVDGVAFLGSACSCTVKEQNPGFDLLTTWDWNATADKMAESDPSLAPMDPYWEVPQGEADPAATAADEPEDGEKESASDPPASSGPATGEENAKSEDPAAVAKTGGASTSDDGAGEEVEPAEASASVAQTAAESRSDSFASRQALRMGLGIGIAAILVIAVGFVLMRRP